MGTSFKGLQPVKNKPGAPLYVSVKEAMLDAIRAGHFEPGERLPSTKTLSEILAVSLVTTHRAMQELEARGVIDRVQGRGTFIADRNDKNGRKSRLALVLQPEVSLADFYNGQLLEGMNRAAREEGAELVILHYHQQLRAECQGYFLLNLLPDPIESFCKQHADDTPVLIVGAHHNDLPSVDVDNADLIRQAVKHVHRLGHRRIGYIGGTPALSNSRDRQAGFQSTCDELKVPAKDRFELKAEGWRITDDEKMALSELLSRPERPTAIIAGGYCLSLDIYNVASTLGMSIPEDISIVGVDDPPSAVHLHPPLTTVRQPLVELGYAAINRMITLIHEGPSDHTNQLLKAELIIRESSGAPPQN